MLTRSSLCAVILLGMIAISCERGEPNRAGDSAVDSDGDGLADVDETKVYHTSPDTKDTDGDGYDDYQEVRELGYDPSNPTKFNPLVADTPRIKIELITVPEVEVTYTRSKGDTKTSEIGSTVTTGRSLMSSRSEEKSLSLSVGYSSGLSGGFSATATAGISVNLTEQETNEYQEALSQIRSNSQNTELHQEGGLIRVAVAISNDGHIPFTLQNLTLTAAQRDRTKTRPITQLEADSARPFFEMGTWVPGERSECLFVGRNLPLSDVERILTSKLVVQVGKYELKDANGQSFGHRTAAIDAACARIVIDQGAGLPAESYMVSTRTAPDERGLPLNTILDTLGIPAETGKVAWTYRKRNRQGQLATAAGAFETDQTRNGLLRLRAVATDPQQGGRWVIIHEIPANASPPLTRRYDLLEADYRLEDIRVKSRQAVLLAYLRDPDRDGLSTSEEITLGTDPREADTDGDGIADGDEQAAGTDPLRNNALPRPRIASMRSEALGQQVSVAIDLVNPEEAERLHIEWGDGSLPEEIKVPRRTLTVTHRYDSVGKYKIVGTPYAGPRSPGEPYEIQISTVPVLTRKATIQFGTKGWDLLDRISVDGEGNAYLAGEVSDMSSLTGFQEGRVFLARCGRSGEREWVEQFGGEYERVAGLAVDRKGNVHLATHNAEAEGVYGITDVIVTDNAKQVPADYTGISEKQVTLPYIPGQVGQRVNGTDVNRGVGGTTTTIWVKYERLPEDSAKPVLTDIEVRHWVGWRVTLPEGPGWTIVNGTSAGIRGALTTKTKGSVWRNGLVARYMPSRAAGSRILALYLSVTSSGTPPQPAFSWPASVNVKNKSVAMRPAGVDIHRGGGGAYFFLMKCLVEAMPAFDGARQPGKVSLLRTYTPGSKLVEDFAIPPGQRPLSLDLLSGRACYFAQESWPVGLQLGAERRARVLKMSGLSNAASGLALGQQIDWTAILPLHFSLQATAIDASEGLYACGYYLRGSAAAKAGSNVVRYSRKGELSWLRGHGDNERDRSVAIAVDGPGNAYVLDLAAGRTPEKANRGLYDVRLVKYNSSGKVLWMRQFGTELLDVGFSVAVWPPVVPGGESVEGKTIYIAGVTQGDLSDETRHLDASSKLNAFLVAYDRDGKRRFLEQFVLGATAPRVDDVSRTWWREFPVSVRVAVDEKGNVYLGGSSEESLDANYKNQGKADIFLVRFAPNQEGKK